MRHPWKTKGPALRRERGNRVTSGRPSPAGQLRYVQAICLVFLLSALGGLPPLARADLIETDGRFSISVPGITWVLAFPSQGYTLHLSRQQPDGRGVYYMFVGDVMGDVRRNGGRSSLRRLVLPQPSFSVQGATRTPERDESSRAVVSSAISRSAAPRNVCGERLGRALQRRAESAMTTSTPCDVRKSGVITTRRCAASLCRPHSLRVPTSRQYRRTDGWQPRWRPPTRTANEERNGGRGPLRGSATRKKHERGKLKWRGRASHGPPHGHDFLAACRRKNLFTQQIPSPGRSQCPV